MSQPLPIPAEMVAGPVHPILANYIWWLIKRQHGDADAEDFGDKLLAHLEERDEGGQSDEPASSIAESVLGS